jgi:hypothetical protein
MLKVSVSNPNEVIAFFSLSNPSSRIMALGFTQSRTNSIEFQEYFWGEVRHTRMVDKLAVCEPIF